jgi:hypothetical protein
MFRYNLTELDVASAKRNDRTGYERSTIDLGAKRGAAYHWRRELVAAIARYNFCRVIYHLDTPRVSMVGEPHNMKACFGLFDYLLGEITRLADIAWKRDGDGSSKTAVRWKNSYYLGATDGVSQKLHEQFKASQREYEGGAALVHVKDAELDEAYERFFPNAKPFRKKVEVDIVAHTLGYRDGRKINLAKQLEDEV